MTKIVLIHGAWAGAWCWYRLTPELEARGYESVPIDLPGRGRSQIKIEQATMADFINHIADVLDGLGSPAYLVADNIHAIPATEAAEERPDQVAGLIYLAGLFAPPGQLHRPLDTDSMIRPGRRITHNGSVQEVRADWEEDIYYHDCPPEVVAEVRGRMVPEIADLSPPPRPTPARYWPDMPKAYILSRRNRCMSLALQRRMVEDYRLHPAIEMDTGACPFLSDPAGLADHMDHIIQQMQAWAGADDPAHVIKGEAEYKPAESGR